jgi:hypothetical protein
MQRQPAGAGANAFLGHLSHVEIGHPADARRANIGYTIISPCFSSGSRRTLQSGEVVPMAQQTMKGKSKPSQGGKKQKKQPAPKPKQQPPAKPSQPPAKPSQPPAKPKQPPAKPK